MKLTLAVFLNILIFLEMGLAQSVHPSFEFKNIPEKILNPITKSNPTLFQSLPTPFQMDKILEAFYGTGEFESLEISRQGDKVIVMATPLKIIANIDISGTKKLSKNDVLGAFAIAQGDKFIFQNVYDAAERIKEIYGKNGYFNAIVNIDTQPVSNNRIHLQIIIEENLPCLVKDIEFITTFTDLNEQIKKRTRYYLNKPLTDELIIDIESTIKDLFTDRKILSASIQGPIFQYNEEKTESYIKYTLENAYRYILFFEGNEYFSTPELTSKLEINDKVQFGSNPAAELASRLEKIYQSYGFAHVVVKYTENVHAKSFSRRAYFKIAEGPRTFLRKVKVHGKLSRPPEYYAGLYKKIYDTRVYRQDRVKVAQEDLVIALQDQGFLKAEFLSSQTTFSKDNRRATLEMFIDEGPQTLVNSISFSGINAFSSAQLKDAVGLKEQTPLNLRAAEASTQRIIDFYRSQGYLEMELKSSLSELIKYSADNTKADLYYQIYEGPQIRVDKIMVEGNEKTKAYVIKNELEFDEGEILTPQNIGDSEYHLQKTGLFTQVEITTLEKGTQTGNRTVLIRVSERDPGLFNLGVGLNTEFDLTIRGYAGLSYNNIAGTARALSGRVEIKKVADLDFLDHTLTLGYLEPTLFAKRTRGRINLIRTREITSRTNQIEVLESNRLNLLLEKDFTRFLKMTWVLWSISTNKEFVYPTDQILSKVNIATIGPIIEYDKRDHPFVTRKGHYTKLSTEYGDRNLGSSDTVHYIRNALQFNTYVPAQFGGIIWASQVGGGYLKNTENKANSFVPEIKSFKLGGRDTVRGFEPNEIPGDFDKNNKPVLVRDDSHYYLLKTEFRIPLWGQIESVLFYDGGAVYVRGNEFEDPYRDSAGIGFRYQTPVGPLSVEYGRRLDRRDLDEPSGRFHLSFGTF